MQIFDTHCHYNLEPLFSGQTRFFSEQQMSKIQNLKWQNHWQTARQAGVTASLVAGADLLSSQRAVYIAQEDANLYASVGIHPSEEIEADTESGADASNNKLQIEFEQIQSLAQDPSVVAIGETGLDYYYFSPQEPKKNKQLRQLQTQLFIKHIKLANHLSKTLIIHSRDQSEQAYWEIFKLLKTHYQFNAPCIFHCFSGSKDFLLKLLELDVYISFAGNITYDSAHELQALIPLVPSDKLLIETDAPFLPPQTHRSQINQPYMIIETAQFLAKKFQIQLEQLLLNSYHCFKLSIPKNY